MPRYSAFFFMTVVLRVLSTQYTVLSTQYLNARPAGDEPAAERQFVGDASEDIARCGLGQTGDLKGDHARLDDGGPVFRLALALAHARLGRDGGHRLVREDADEQPALAAHRVGCGDAARLDCLGRQPPAFDRLQAELAVGNGVALRGLAFDP